MRPIFLYLNNDIVRFQSTHPLRDATKIDCYVITGNTFQSTHPLRDATLAKEYKDINVLISIHAPLTGCDTYFLFTLSLYFNFNPRTPYGMRHIAQMSLIREDIISIHAPLTGCDLLFHLKMINL